MGKKISDQTIAIMTNTQLSIYIKYLHYTGIFLARIQMSVGSMTFMRQV